MIITDKILEMLNDVDMINGRYVITDDMDPELREVCEKTNAKKDWRAKIFEERRKRKMEMRKEENKNDN